MLNGTWGGGAPSPPQWHDFLLMKRMHWSWEQLQNTPLYVRRYSLDFLGLISEAEEKASKKAERRSEAASRRN